MQEDKHYLSIYYGIDETLPDKEFYKKIKELNCLAEESTKKFCRNNPHPKIKMGEGQTARGGGIPRTEQKFEISTKNQKQGTKSPKNNYKIK